MNRTEPKIIIRVNIKNTVRRYSFIMEIHDVCLRTAQMNLQKHQMPQDKDEKR